VDYSFNEMGQLVGALGRRWGSRTARCGRTRTETVVDPGRWWTSRRRSCGEHLCGDRGAGAGGEECDDELRGDGGEWVFTKITDTGRTGIAGA
jgi:hypothetical protein